MTGESPLAKRYKKLRARVGSSDRSGPKSHVKFYAVLPEEISGRTTHYVGLPPALTGGDDQRQRMPGTRIMFLEELPEGGFLLVRFSSDGVFAGDTWHETASDLKDAAQWEFDRNVEWHPLPPLEDPVSFVLNSLNDGAH